MKLPIGRLTFLMLLGCARAVAAQEGAQPARSPARVDDSASVVAWIGRNAIPLRHVAPGNGTADLQPLSGVLRDVRIIGLGEATHGTRELFQLKHRLLEFLVTEMGFTALALEASYAACQPINDYVLGGARDRATVLTEQGYVVWDTEEFAAMLDWLRAYNRRVPAERKVRFYGLDLFWNAVGRDTVRAYLRRVAPDSAAAIDSVFRVLDAEDAKRPLSDKAALASARPRLDALATYLDSQKAALVRRSSLAEFDRAAQAVRVMRQALMAKGNEERSRHMAGNLLYLVDRERPGAKVVLWAHNVHVGTGRESKSPGASPADAASPYMGHFLRQRYGARYYAVGFEFGEGAYQARVFPPREPPGDLRAVVLPAAPPGSLAWYLSRANVGNLFLDLRKAPRGDSVVARWLAAPQVLHHGSWAYQEPSEAYSAIRIGGQFDGLLFIQRTTATRPTPNAQKTVANRKGI